jgi:plastocyanin
MRTSATSRSRKILLYIVLPPLLFAVAIVLVVFLYLRFHSPVELDVTAKGFTLSTVEITEGETVHIVNQSSVVQVLCLGQDRVCDPSALAPTVLKSPGARLAPGASVNVAFQLYGTYNVTSTSTPGVNLQITVDAGG